MKSLSRPNGVRFAALVVAALFASGCLGPQPGADVPAAHRNLVAPDARLDERAARDVINAFRASNGLSPVALNGRLTRLAEAHARDLAEGARRGRKWAPHDRLKERLAAVNYQIGEVGEAVGAGYDTIAEAVAGWRGSPEHRKIMLLASAQHMGIAKAYLPGTPYEIYWVLVMARPLEESGPRNPLRLLFSSLAG